VGGRCSHYLKCYVFCESNSDCKNFESTPCCSNNYCTDSIVCAGNKQTGDFCEKESECFSEICNKIGGFCEAKLRENDATSSDVKWIIISVVAIFLTLIAFSGRKLLSAFGSRNSSRRHFSNGGSGGNSDDRYFRSSTASQNYKSMRENSEQLLETSDQQIFHSEEVQEPYLLSDYQVYDEASHLVDQSQKNF
jgi:hypothetical protein